MIKPLSDEHKKAPNQVPLEFISNKNYLLR